MEIVIKCFELPAWLRTLRLAQTVQSNNVNELGILEKKIAVLRKKIQEQAIVFNKSLKEIGL